MTQDTIRVTYVTGELGLGGTQKGLVSYATRLNRDQFTPKVVTLHEGGPRQADLIAGGVPVTVGCGEPEALAHELAGADIVHAFRQGTADPLVPTAAARAGVPVLIESNIFGARDRSPDEARFDCHLLISMMCLMRYRRGAPLDGQFEARHRVLYLPLEAEPLRALAPSRAEARQALGLDPDRPVVARLGRAADLKWRDLLVDMVPHLVGLVPEVQVVFVGATEAKRARLARRGVADRVTLIEPVARDENLARLYAACDVVVNASMIGESQGLVIAEAMSLGIPVVTCSTPWADNAQIEFVENGHNGWVASHPREFAEAAADLLRRPDRAREFGQRGRDTVDRRLDPNRLTRQLESLYLHHLRGAEIADWQPDAREMARFEQRYPEAARASFRSLTRRERAEAWAARAREMVAWRSAGARVAATSAWSRLRSA